MIDPIATRGLTRASEARQSGAAASIFARWSRRVSLRIFMVIEVALASNSAATPAGFGTPVEAARTLVETGYPMAGRGIVRRQPPRL